MYQKKNDGDARAPRPMKTIILGASALMLGAISACATHRAFGPTEHVKGRTIEGYKEAFYDLAHGGRRIGEVKVWSRGAFAQKANGEKGTDVHIGLEIEANGDKELELDLPSIRLLWEEGEAEREVGVTAHSGSTKVAAHSRGSTEMTFRFPPGVGVTDIKAFRLVWSVLTGDERYTEFTPFVPQRNEPAYIPVYGYYYPYFGYGWPYYDPWFYDGASVVIVRPYPRRLIVYPGPRGQPYSRR